MVATKNDEASMALVALRKALDLTQQQFAVTLLDHAVTTVSRWESGNPPPRGESLLRLRAIAYERQLGAEKAEDKEKEALFRHLKDTFDRVWAMDAWKQMPDIGIIVIGDDDPKTGLVVLSLKGSAAFPAAKAFTSLIRSLGHPDSKIRSTAIDAFTRLQAAARRFDAPGTHDIEDLFLGRFAPPSGPAKRGRPKKSSIGDKNQ